MKTPIKTMNHHSRLFALLAPALLLTACGPSDNLQGPSQAGAVTQCSQLAATTCVNGRFMADAVANLDYECGDSSARIRGKTAVDGSFSCPANKPVTFSLVNPDPTVAAAEKHVITLGTTTVKVPAELGQSAGNIFVNTYFYVTPLTLAGGNTTTAQNITRLLQGIRIADTHVVSDAARRVVIDDLDKNLLKAPLLSRDVNASDAGFVADITPWLNALDGGAGKTLASVADADAILKKSRYSTVSGIYFVPGYLANPGTELGCANSVSTAGLYLGGMCGLNASDYFLGATWGMVDRRGRIVGFGVYSEGPILPPAGGITQEQWDACKFLVQVGDTSAAVGSNARGCLDAPKKQPDRLPLAVQDPSASQFWPLWNDNAAWNFSYTLLDASNAATARSMNLEGSVDRDAIAGSDYLYRNYYNGETGGVLGKWAMTGSYLNTQTRFSMQRARTIAPTLDPSFWCAATDVDCADAGSFPMNVKLKFYSSYDAGGTACTTAPGCPVGELRVTLLRDGSVISNRFGASCAADYADTDAGTNTYNLDPLTLASNLGQDYPLGVVAQAYAIEDRSYASLMLVVPYKPAVAEFAGLLGVQMGTTTASYTTLPVRMRIDNDAGANRLKLYTEYTVAGNTMLAASTDIDASAGWSDEYRFLKGDKNTRGVVLAEEDSACP